jgi:hypothetical protein
VRPATGSALTLLDPATLVLVAERGIDVDVRLDARAVVTGDGVRPVEPGLHRVSWRTGGMLHVAVDGERATIVVIAAGDADRAWVLDTAAGRVLALADDPLWVQDGSVRVRSSVRPEVRVWTGGAGSGAAGTGTSGTGAAGTGTSGTGAAGTGTSGTGTSGTGAAGSDAAGLGGPAGSGAAIAGGAWRSAEVRAAGSSRPPRAVDHRLVRPAGTVAAGTGAAGHGTEGHGAAGTGAPGTGTVGYGSAQGRASAPAPETIAAHAARWDLHDVGTAAAGDDRRLLTITWAGDVAELLVDGRVVADRFWDGTPWLLDLDTIPGAEGGRVSLRVLPLHPEAEVWLPAEALDRRRSQPGLLCALDAVTLERSTPWSVAAGVDG